MRPGFPNYGACERLDCHESGVLWADFQQNQGLENEYFVKFSSFLMKIAAKFWLLELKITTFSENVWFWKKNVTFFFEMVVLWTELHLNWGLANGRRCVKRGSWGPHIPVPPFSVECPPQITIVLIKCIIPSLSFKKFLWKPKQFMFEILFVYFA